MAAGKADQAARDASVKAAFDAYEYGRTITDEKGRNVPKPYVEQRALWEAMWTAADFSWAGLADAGWERGVKPNAAQKLKRWRAPAAFPLDAPVQGEGEEAFKPASLQDYWRWVPNAGWSEDQGWAGGRLASDDELKALGLLVEIDGVLWHALHRAELSAATPAARGRLGAGLSGPGEDPPSAPPFQGREALAAAILFRLALAETSRFYRGGRRLVGPDGRAQLTGARAEGLDAVWLEFDGERLHLSAPLAAFDTLDIDLTFGDGAYFRSATFGDGAFFGSATFGDGAAFNFAAFGDGADFREATFGDRADFDSATFGDGAYFRLATFGDGAGFRSATFGDGARFGSATFGGGAVFRSATFGDWAVFASATFGDGASFRSATFRDLAHFYSATFGDGAHFFAATFGDRADFSSATFGDGAYFASATFGDGAEFRAATFGDRADFNSATFRDRTDFRSATFGGLDLSNATFGGKFSGPQLRCKGRFQMRAAEIKGYADFSGATWPDKLEDQHAAFEGCRFRDVADFKTEGFTAFALFDGAEFKGRLLLAEPGDSASDALFKSALKAAQAAAKADPGALKALQERNAALPDDKKGEAEPELLDERGADARFGALAGGLRTLKLAMKEQGDVDREQRFYRYELKARARRPAEPAIAKFAAGLYGLVSDYGASIGRPFGALAVTLLAFAGLYLAVALGLDAAFGPVKAAEPLVAHLPDNFFHALNFSIANTFKPLSALSTEGLEGNPIARDLLSERGPAWGALIRGFAVIQSLFALVLAFLVALAVRRRFQIA